MTAPRIHMTDYRRHRAPRRLTPAGVFWAIYLAAITATLVIVGAWGYLEAVSP